MKEMRQISPSVRKDLTKIFGEKDSQELLQLCNEYLTDVGGDTLQGMLHFFREMAKDPAQLDRLKPNTNNFSIGTAEPAAPMVDGSVVPRNRRGYKATFAIRPTELEATE